MAALGYATNWSGVTSYVEHLRTSLATQWTYCAYFTKYPLSWFAYASIGGPRWICDQRPAISPEVAMPTI